MGVPVSTPVRFFVAVLFIGVLIAQVTFSSTYMMAQAYAHNGRISHQNKQWEETVWFYGHANQWYPYSHHWWYSVGVGEKEQGHFNEAVDAMEQSIIQAPNFVLGYIRSAALKYQAKDIEVANSLTLQVDPLVPRHQEVNYLQGLVLANAGNMVEAREHLLESRRDALEPHQSIEALLTHTALETKEYDVALAAATRLTELQPEVAKHWLTRGKVHWQAGQPQMAQETSERALALYQAEYNTVVEAQSISTKLPQGLLESYTILGELYAGQGNYAEALEAFYAVAAFQGNVRVSTKTLQALSTYVNVSDVQEAMQWASVLGASRHWDEANIIFETLDGAALSTVARYHYAMTLRQLGDLDGALVQFAALPTRSFISSLSYADTLRVAGKQATARLEYSKILNGYAGALSDRQRKEITAIINQLATQ
jgi:tetratricopeptide (TPR) repeat protein